MTTDSSMRALGLTVAVSALLLSACSDPAPTSPEDSSGASPATTTQKAPSTGASGFDEVDATALSDAERAELEQDSELLKMVLEDVTAMTPSELAEMLPASVEGMARVDAGAMPKETLGAAVTTASANYHGDDGATLKLSITDLGGMLGLARLGMQWINDDGESADGFARTGVHEGFKTFEKHDSAVSPSRSEMRVFVGERFVVEITGLGVSWDTVTAAANSVDLAELDQVRRAAAP